MPPKPGSPTEEGIFPQRRPLILQELKVGVEAALEAQREGVRNGKRPFAAVLLGPDNAQVLLRQFSLSHVEHAESEICRSAASQFTPEYLWKCTLVSTWEPCAMCAGVLYWSNIGTLVYLASEKALQGVVGESNEENFTLDLPCRDVLAKGQKDIRVLGPFDGVGSSYLANWQAQVCTHAFDSYWKEQRGIDMKWSDYALFVLRKEGESPKDMI